MVEHIANSWKAHTLMLLCHMHMRCIPVLIMRTLGWWTQVPLVTDHG